MGSYVTISIKVRRELELIVQKLSELADGSPPFRAGVLCPLGLSSLVGAPHGHGVTAQAPPLACGEVRAPCLLGSPTPNS